jgi:hypothetical protein
MTYPSRREQVFQSDVTLRETAAMPINSLNGVFEPEATALMGEAFDAACKELPASGQSRRIRELIATLIIAAAVHGEFDPVRLRAAALSGLSTVKEMSCLCTPAHLVEQ